jgi:tripartite-type tricarboxylate transporter receptor subunit TctC
LTLGTFSSSLYIEQLMGRREVQYDWSKFAWIGNPERIDRMLYIRADSPYKTLDDIRKASAPPKCGASGAGTPSHYLPKLLAEALGFKVDVVLGYSGTADISLAIERGEVHCWAGGVQALFGLEPMRTWTKTGFVRVLAQTGKRRDPRIPDVPTIWELMETYKTPDSTRRLARVIIGGDEFGRPYAAAPGTPVERVKFLRQAFLKLLSEPELLAEAKKREWAVAPSGGDELEALAKEMMVQPPEVIEAMKRLLAK